MQYQMNSSEQDFQDDLPLTPNNQDYYYDQENEMSPPMDNEGGNENFKVAVRVRPPVPREMEGNRPFVNVVRIPNEKSISLCEHLETEDGRGSVFSTQTFTFDHVYQPSDMQDCVYERSANSAVNSVLQGYNATLIAYGQTGTGKTYTMEGFTSDENRGIIPRATEAIFAHIQSSRMANMKFLVRASYLQIYNENISDLLKPHNKQLSIRHTNKRGVYIENLSEWVVRSPNDVYGLMERGMSLRATGSTKMSELSSRSHAMFMIIVEMMEGDESNPKSYKFGKLNIVDLAGSEKVRQTQVTGQRLKETQKINWSLHELGNVIAALTDRKRKDKHIPFRNSCLTRALQDSLGGNCKTTLIACISPALESYHESLSTLKFANRAKNIKNDATVNEGDVDASILLKRYEKELKTLKEELAQKDMIIHSGATGGIISQLELERENLKRSAAAALAQLEEKNRNLSAESQEKEGLRSRIAELEEIVNNGGFVGGKPITSDEYAVRLDELDKERQVVEEDKAQVDRYKQLLLKQRDIMLNLTTRLNERDEQILRLQEEIEAYDAHVRMVEESMQSQMPQLSTKTEATSYLRSIRRDTESKTLYRAEGGADEWLSAEDKIVELFMLRGRAPMSADDMYDRSDERRSMQVVLRDRVEIAVQKSAGEKIQSLMREIDSLRQQLDTSEDRRRTLEFSRGGNDSTEKVRRYLDQEQEQIKSNYNIRIAGLQNELDAERKQRRHLTTELDKYRFELSQALNLVDPAQKERMERLYQHVSNIEDNLVQDIIMSSPSQPSSPVYQDPMSSAGSGMKGGGANVADIKRYEAMISQLRQDLDSRDRKSEADLKSLKQENQYLAQQLQKAQSTGDIDPQAVEELKRKLNTQLKDKRALKSIMQNRVKVKVDSIRGHLDNRNVADGLKEIENLQSLVNAAINAMDEQ